jgi:hypothetical protein
MNVSYLVLCSPDKVIDTGVVLLEKSGDSWPQCCKAVISYFVLVYYCYF